MSDEKYHSPEAQTVLNGQPIGSAAAPNGPTRSGRRRLPTLLTLVAAAAIAILALMPSPYVIEQPGPVHDTLGSTTIGGKDVPVIAITGTDTFDTTGRLNLLTVSLVGNPEETPNWVTVALSWFDPSKTVIPIEQVFPPTVTSEQRAEENQTLMVNSQQTAIAAALNQQKIPFTTDLTVGSVTKGSPADGALQVNDIVKSVNGETVSNVAQMRSKLDANGTDKPAIISIVRGGVPLDVSIVPTTAEANNGQKIIVVGVGITEVYAFPFDVTIHLDRVGGPSAGMMFALGIIDKITPEDLAGGKNVAGTGTIEADGTVGAIGGVRQKFFAANAEGATVFLIPRENCSELGDGLPGGTEIYAVEKLSDSINILSTLKNGADTSSLPRCPTNNG